MKTKTIFKCNGIRIGLFIDKKNNNSGTYKACTEYIKNSNCKHCLGSVTVNEIGEKGCFCELTNKWENITLGDCFGNCEAQLN